MDPEQLCEHRGLVGLDRQGVFADRVAVDEGALVSVPDGLDDRVAALVEPLLEALAGRFGETAHYAELDGAEVVYLAKITPPGIGVQMTSIVGGRNPAHCTGVGKALLAYELSDRDAVDAYVAANGPLVRRTRSTLVDAGALDADFDLVRARGYALDRQESEEGINCIAFPLFLDHPAQPTGSVSVAALAHRTALAQLEEAAGEVRGLIAGMLGTAT